MATQGLTDNMIDNIATGSEAEAEAMMDAFEKAHLQRRSRWRSSRCRI